MFLHYGADLTMKLYDIESIGSIYPTSHFWFMQVAKNVVAFYHCGMKDRMVCY